MNSNQFGKATRVENVGSVNIFKLNTDTILKKGMPQFHRIIKKKRTKLTTQKIPLSLVVVLKKSLTFSATKSTSVFASHSAKKMCCLSIICKTRTTK